MTGVPPAESVLRERCDSTANAALVMFIELQQMAADGEALHGDDTRVTILFCLKESDESEDGLNSTCVTGILIEQDNEALVSRF